MKATAASAYAHPDTVAVMMSTEEETFLRVLLNKPTVNYIALVELLRRRDECKFAKQQAALMLRNTPGAAAHLLKEDRA